MRWFFILMMALLVGAGCATRHPVSSQAQVALTLSESKPGDRTALLEVENHTKELLAYDGPYVEYLTNGNWTAYTSDVPEMENLKQTHRTGPTQSSVWWVRVPPGHSTWRAYIHARLWPLKKPEQDSKEFTVWSKEISR